VGTAAWRDAEVMEASPITTREWPRYLRGFAVPVLATGVGLAVGEDRTAAAALIYLLFVLPVATLSGRGPAIVASLLSFLGLNFFFTPPRHTLSVSKSDDLIALVVFLSVALVVSALASRSASERDRARRREYEARSLYSISTRLLTTQDLEPVLGELAAHVRTLFGLTGCQITTVDEHGAVLTGTLEGDVGTDPVRMPLEGSSRNFGTLAMNPGRDGFGEPEQRVAQIFAQQLAAALERATLEREAREARVAAEAASVRQALLSAVSHDFRTPLSSIKAALTALVPSPQEEIVPPSEEDRAELLSTALEETRRLERLVTNLLDLTRLRSGSLSPSRTILTVQDLLDEALEASRRLLVSNPVELKVRDDVAKVDVDPVQVGQVFRNVLENAVRYAPTRSPIRITAGPWRDSVEIRIADRGSGIAEGEREAVFEEFFRGGDGRSAGTGLGLAIARALVRANDGDIWAEETPGGGATIAIRLPMAGRT
jgi:two-component system, OmpR family, sensor histidine kinase KdpD